MERLQILKSTIKMPLMRLPVNSVIVRTQKGAILFSPGSKLDREVLSQVGPITDIVAPNLFHSAGVPKAASLFPNAKLWCAPGLQKKRSDIRWNNELNPSIWPHQNELPILLMEGAPQVNEVVAFDSQSKTLIVADLCFHIQDAKGWGAALILGLFGTHNRFAVSRLQMLLMKNKVAFEKSFTQLIKWDFEKIIMSHGSPVERNGKEALLEAFHERGVHINS